MKSHTAPRNLSQVSKTSPRRIRGQGMTEYIVIVAIVALTAVVATSFFGDAIQGQFVSMGQTLTGAASTGLTDAATNNGTAVESVKAVDDLGSYAN